MSRELMKQCLDALNIHATASYKIQDAVKALEAELAKPEQKPTLFFGRAVYFADPKTGEIKNEVTECLQ
jgi:histidinol phosphatase-like enzyme